jgi:hypothetical protein
VADGFETVSLATQRFQLQSLPESCYGNVLWNVSIRIRNGLRRGADSMPVAADGDP